MSKWKSIADGAFADILQFVDNDSDVDDEFNDYLDIIYGSDDLNAAQQDSSDDEYSFDNDGDVEMDIQRPSQKKWLINSTDKSLDKNCYDPHDFGVAEDLASEKRLEVFLGPKKNSNTKKIFGQTNICPMPVLKDHAMSCHVLLNHQHFFLLLLTSIPSMMHLKFYFQIRWFNW